jgi:hypothetical protein
MALQLGSEVDCVAHLTVCDSFRQKHQQLKKQQQEQGAGEKGGGGHEAGAEQPAAQPSADGATACGDGTTGGEGGGCGGRGGGAEGRMDVDLWDGPELRRLRGKGGVGAVKDACAKLLAHDDAPLALAAVDALLQVTGWLALSVAGWLALSVADCLLPDRRSSERRRGWQGSARGRWSGQGARGRSRARTRGCGTTGRG